METTMDEAVNKGKKFGIKARDIAVGLGLTALGIGVSMAGTAGPFGAISTFVNTNFLPGVGTIGVAGGIGYAAVHAFKHDYGKATVGLGVAAGGGFFIANSSWVVTQTKMASAATIGGAHIPLIESALHAFGM